MKKLKLYLIELRAPFFTASVIPVLLGAATAYRKTGVLDFPLFLITLIWGVLIHAGANVANDYFDFKSGNDDANKEFVSPFTGGSRLIQNKLLSPEEVKLEFIILLLLAACITVFLAFKFGLLIFISGAIGIFSAYFYIAPPVSFANRGIGELIVGLNLGFILCAASYYVQAGILDIIPILASIPVAFLIVAVLYINQFPDYKADKEAGKNNIVVRLGRKKAAAGYVFLMISAYFFIILFVLLKVMPLISSAALLTFPLVLKSINTLRKNYDNPQGLAEACGLTIILHLTVGLLISASYFI